MKTLCLQIQKLNFESESSRPQYFRKAAPLPTRTVQEPGLGITVPNSSEGGSDWTIGGQVQ